MGWMRLRLSTWEKDRINAMLDEGKASDTIAKLLNRPKNTIYNYVNYYRFTPFRVKRDTRTRVGPNLITEEGRSIMCPVCEVKLVIDTDGNGRLVEYCQTCVKPTA